MIAIIIGTVIGGVLTVVAVHYVRVGLRRVVKKDRRYDLPSGE